LHLKTPLNLIDLRENHTDMMIGFGPSVSTEIQFRKLGQLHFIPICTRDYVRNHGLPTSSNLEQHLFLQSEYYLAKTGCGTVGSRPRRAGASPTAATTRSPTA
jgi:hypothetical protein